MFSFPQPTISLQYVYNEAPAPIYCTFSTKVIMEASAQRLKLKQNWSFRIIKPSDHLVIEGRDFWFFQTTQHK